MAIFLQWRFHLAAYNSLCFRFDSSSVLLSHCVFVVFSLCIALVYRPFVVSFSHPHLLPPPDKDASRIELTNVPSSTLDLIIQYMTYHTSNGRTAADIKDIAKPIRSLDMKKICADPWDAVFVDSQSTRTIFDLILAANYMQIDPLLNLCCAKVATVIKSMVSVVNVWCVCVSCLPVC